MNRIPSDTALIERLQAGDDAAVAELARTYGARVYQLALRYTRNKEDAEEVVQDVLLKVRDKIDAFRGDAALSSWIYRITFNTAMSRLRSTRSARFHEVSDDTGNVNEDGSPRVNEPADWSGLGDDAVQCPEGLAGGPTRDAALGARDGREEVVGLERLLGGAQEVIDGARRPRGLRGEPGGATARAGHARRGVARAR